MDRFRAPIRAAPALSESSLTRKHRNFRRRHRPLRRRIRRPARKDDSAVTPAHAAVRSAGRHNCRPSLVVGRTRRTAMAASQHRKDGQWLKTIDELLGGDRQKHLAARDKLWREVLAYIEFGAHLNIGPLSDDPDARRDIGCIVLKKLEAN